MISLNTSLQLDSGQSGRLREGKELASLPHSAGGLECNMTQLEFVTVLILRLQDDFYLCFRDRSFLKIVFCSEGVFLRGLRSRAYCIGRLSKIRSSCFIAVTEGMGAKEISSFELFLFKGCMKFGDPL